MWGEWYHQTLHWSSFAISKTRFARFSSWVVCCLRFLLSGTALFTLASWGDYKSVIPFWGLFAGSQRDWRSSHLIFLCLSWVPRDTHVFNYSALAWHSLVAETWQDIWFSCFNVTLKYGAVLRISLWSNSKAHCDRATTQMLWTRYECQISEIDV